MNHNEFPVWISFVILGQTFVLDFPSDKYDVDSGETTPSNADKVANMTNNSQKWQNSEWANLSEIPRK